jgi:hypothetical protein
VSKITFIVQLTYDDIVAIVRARFDLPKDCGVEIDVVEDDEDDDVDLERN